MKKKEKIYYIVSSMTFIICIGLLVWNATYHSPYGDYYSFLGGIIGGIATLAAVILSIIETRKIQEENKEITRKIQDENLRYSNNLLKIQILNEKILDYKILHKSISEFMNYFDEFADFCCIIPPKITVDYKKDLNSQINKITKLNDNIRINGKCVESLYFNKKLCDLNGKNLDFLSYEKKIYHEAPTLDEVRKIHYAMIDFLEKWILEYNDFFIELTNEISSLYVEKYSIANRKNL
ncbi:hypothetical protein [Clostridium sp. 'White wine YQ']|uniref:hypothetical protein n=1 Tax=Clostridium sp. 'White wine YQ' TaxID=3027474 RepID=UPI0023663D39|nr:hypothetical protein [Clostridium sp. 'White wine YQ']MDD7793680.1 hypothetical protein [Clostridium sp. 'White wine YQ']